MQRDLDFSLTRDQLDIRNSIRSFLAERAPVSLARGHLEGTVDRTDRDVWNQLSDRFGAQGICIPEQYGGLGMALDDLSVALAEMGATLLPGPYWETVALTVPLLLATEPSEERDRWLHAIATGSAAATVAFMTSDGSFPSRAVTATKTGGSWSLSGQASLVLDADIADLVLVLADSVDGLQVLAVDAARAELKVERAGSLDPTRQLFSVQLDRVEAVPLATRQGAEEALASTLDFACVALAAEQVGAARRCLERTVQATLDRVQFDRPIASFQAVQHRCADALIELEGAESAVYYAAWAHAAGSDEFPLAASVAKIAASDALMRAATDFVHLSGTMGYTREHDASLYYRRAKWSSLLLGSAQAHRTRVADRLSV